MNIFLYFMHSKKQFLKTVFFCKIILCIFSFRKCILFVYCHSTWPYSHYPIQLITVDSWILLSFQKWFSISLLKNFVFLFFSSILIFMKRYFYIYLYLAGKYGGKITATSIVETPKNREKVMTSYEINIPNIDSCMPDTYPNNYWLYYSLSIKYYILSRLINHLSFFFFTRKVTLYN